MTMTTIDESCPTDPDAAADMSRFNPGAPPIPCRPWETGTDVRGYVWHAPEPRAVLLLQHGFGEYAQRYVGQYSALIPNLLHIGMSVYAFDLQGHGRSPGRRAVTDVETAVADHLAARRKLEALSLPLFLLGHSLGGIVTATSAARDPSNLRGVVLSSPALLVTANPFTRLLARAAAAVAPALPVRRLAPSGISRLAEQVELLKTDSLMYRGAMPARLAASVLFTSRGNWGLYPRWEAPTLLIHGTADTFTEPEGSRRFIATIASQDKTLYLVEGGYHELLNDVERDETLRVLLNWLERRLPTKGE